MTLIQRKTGEWGNFSLFDYILHLQGFRDGMHSFWAMRDVALAGRLDESRQSFWNDTLDRALRNCDTIKTADLSFVDKQLSMIGLSPSQWPLDEIRAIVSEIAKTAVILQLDDQEAQRISGKATDGLMVLFGEKLDTIGEKLDCLQGYHQRWSDPDAVDRQAEMMKEMSEVAEAVEREAADEPIAVDDEAIATLEAEEGQADGIGQDEELAIVAAKIKSTEKGPTPEQTAAMVLEARDFSFNNCQSGEPNGVNRHHFWYLLMEAGYTPAQIRDVWNDGLDEELRKSLGDPEKVSKQKKGTNRIREAIKRHRKKLEKVTSKM